MSKEKEVVTKIHGILDSCRKQIEKEIGVEVTINYKLKFHHLSTYELREIVLSVCNVTWAELTSKVRKSEIIIARQLYSFFARTVQKKSLRVISDEVGNGDHTSVMHSVKIIRDMIDSKNELYIQYFTEIESRINNR